VLNAATLMTTTELRSPPTALTTLCALLALAACAAPEAAHDGGTVPSDAARSADATGDGGEARDAAGLDAAADGATIDGATIDDATIDGAATDSAAIDAAAIDAGPPVGEAVLLVAREGSTAATGASWTGGTWGAIEPIGTGILNVDLGVVVMDDGTGLGIFTPTGLPAFIHSARWSAGAWGPLSTSDVAIGRASLPIRASGGALLAAAVSTPGISELALARYDASSGAWSSSPERTGVFEVSGSQFVGSPAVALMSSGDPLVVFGRRVGTSAVVTYDFTVRTGAAWSADALIPGAVGPSSFHGIAITSQDDHVLAVWIHGSAGAEIHSAVYAAGTWSTEAAIATDVIAASFRPLLLTSLPDGRVALAYLTHVPAEGTAMVRIGFFDGSSWSAFREVPGARAFYTSLMFALARGAGSAVLELAYVDSAHAVRHTRLMDEATWTWTAPTVADGGIRDCIALAVGP
jgi:hypothetical protein